MLIRSLHWLELNLTLTSSCNSIFTWVESISEGLWNGDDEKIPGDMRF